MRTLLKGGKVMEGNHMIRRIQMDCPLCGKVHEVEERRRIAGIVIKDDEVHYEETYYFCPNSDEDESGFVTGKMENENLLNARNAYRISHGLLTSNEIVAIREKYALSQVDMSKLLGWGEATISRYESKAIQDEVYDSVLRTIRDNPFAALELLQKNGAKFTALKKSGIKNKIIENLDADGREYLQRQALQSEYVDYQEPCDANGYKPLDIDKLELIVSYFAKRISYLYKVKLVKLLWYADSLYFKTQNIAMTGLVYCHDGLGALPIGHYEIVGLENIKVSEESDCEHTKYRFLPNEKLDEGNLSDAEKEVLDRVIDKFKTFNSTEIVNYMHDETAYRETEDKEVIPFSLAREIREF